MYPDAMLPYLLICSLLLFAEGHPKHYRQRRDDDVGGITYAPCKDTYNQCPEWKKSGMCEMPQYRDYMPLVCTDTCGFCKGIQKARSEITAPTIIDATEHGTGDNGDHVVDEDALTRSKIHQRSKTSHAAQKSAIKEANKEDVSSGVGEEETSGMSSEEKSHKVAHKERKVEEKVKNKNKIKKLSSEKKSVLKVQTKNAKVQKTNIVEKKSSTENKKTAKITESKKPATNKKSEVNGKKSDTEKKDNSQVTKEKSEVSELMSGKGDTAAVRNNKADKKSSTTVAKNSAKTKVENVLTPKKESPKADNVLIAKKELTKAGNLLTARKETPKAGNLRATKKESPKVERLLTTRKELPRTKVKTDAAVKRTTKTKPDVTDTMGMEISGAGSGDTDTDGISGDAPDRSSIHSGQEPYEAAEDEDDDGEEDADEDDEQNAHQRQNFQLNGDPEMVDLKPNHNTPQPDLNDFPDRVEEKSNYSEDKEKEGAETGKSTDDEGELDDLKIEELLSDDDKKKKPKKKTKQKTTKKEKAVQSLKEGKISMVLQQNFNQLYDKKDSPSYQMLAGNVKKDIEKMVKGTGVKDVGFSEVSVEGNPRQSGKTKVSFNIDASSNDWMKKMLKLVDSGDIDGLKVIKGSLEIEEE